MQKHSRVRFVKNLQVLKSKALDESRAYKIFIMVRVGPDLSRPAIFGIWVLDTHPRRASIKGLQKHKSRFLM